MAQDASTTSKQGRPIKAPPVSVFISHTFQDREAGIFAILINEGLRRQGVTTFIDMDIEKTEDFKDSILEAVRTCNLFLCVLCPKYFERDWCVRELIVAQEHERRILPVFYREIEESNLWCKTLLKDAKRKQGFVKPPVTKSDIVDLKNAIVDDVEKRLGYVIPSEVASDVPSDKVASQSEVTIRLAKDDVYKPSQQGWIMGGGNVYTYKQDQQQVSTDFNFLAIHEDQDKQLPKFLLRRSRDLMKNEDCYGYSIELVEPHLHAQTRSLVVEVDTPPSAGAAADAPNNRTSVIRDLFSKYVFLSPPKSYHPEQYATEEAFPWRIYPQGNHQFQLVHYRRKTGNDTQGGKNNNNNEDHTYNHRQTAKALMMHENSIQDHVLNAEYMGMAAHRFWKHDAEVGSTTTRTSHAAGTRVMVSLQTVFWDCWEIRSAAKRGFDRSKEASMRTRRSSF